MTLFAVLFFVLCPLISLPFIFVLLKADIKHRPLYLMLISLFIALFAYAYCPTQKEDLYRHHLDVEKYQEFSSDEIIKELSEEPEQLSVFYKYLIGKTGNENLLQYFTTALSYFILFLILDEFTKKYTTISVTKKFAIWLFVISGFHFGVIISNIFYTLALELFSLGIFFDYYKNKKKSGWLLYITSVFIHTCAFLPLAIILLYKAMGSVLNKRGIVVLIILLMSIGLIVSYVAPLTNIPFLLELSSLYQAYFNNEEAWSELHTIPVLALYLSKLLPIVIGYIDSSEEKRDSMVGFSIFTAIAVLVLFPQTTFSIRYIHIAVLCGIPLLFELVQNKKRWFIYTVLLFGLSIPQIYYQIHQMGGWGSYFVNPWGTLTTNLISLFIGG